MKLMKCLLLCLSLVFIGDAIGYDYSVGQCPVAANCGFGSQPGEYSQETFTFILGNWPEAYGTYDYTSSVSVVVNGTHGITPCSGRGCRGAPYDTQITSATLDGVPMTQVSIYQWKQTISLDPGQHVVAVTAIASGATWYSRIAGQVQGITYTLVANPPCTGCGDD
jgi:hypothetical protein